MEEAFSREIGLLGEEGIQRLLASRVAVFGLGGVGSFAAEALGRAGVGHITLVDGDVVSVSNLNRQLCALHSTIGQSKVEVVKNRLLDIAPDMDVDARMFFFDEQHDDGIDFSCYDYIVDAIDSVPSKIALICKAKACNVPIISAMGAGNKLDPTKFCVADLSKTSYDPLARILRRELKKHAIYHLSVVYSTEEPIASHTTDGEKRVPSSVSFVPSVMGLIMAGEVIKKIATPMTM
ncbi:MAG TPA: tRNA threonylcarbamoyladenosine dehydratase [Bacillota bacterium]|nr:tRNA threonylcarbamoyladenosine dehydratase [Bacillota bacterium]HPE38954.1 tRNA threonylcarbamoyladenosine dehydratase [Bacillota bacterium]